MSAKIIKFPQHRIKRDTSLINKPYAPVTDLSMRKLGFNFKSYTNKPSWQYAKGSSWESSVDSINNYYRQVWE